MLNGALQGLEAEQLRLQLRWEAPPSPALLQVLLEAEVKYVALETCQVWSSRDVWTEYFFWGLLQNCWVPHKKTCFQCVQGIQGIFMNE